MPYNSSDYFAYKKNKFKRDIEQPPKPMSKLNFLFQLFVATFIIMFIVIVFSIMKYSSKMDIEYSKRDISLNSEFAPKHDEYQNHEESNNGEQLKIDKRLILIQQEENAPSEAKIIRDNDKHEIIDPSLIEKNKKIEEQNLKEKKQEQLKNSEKNSKEENLQVNLQDKINFHENSNITIMSKVLVGKFSTFEDAQRLQGVIKAKDNSLTPYVKKVGEIFTVQLGSFKDFETAKKQAQTLKSKGLDAWIYQQ